MAKIVNLPTNQGKVHVDKVMKEIQSGELSWAVQADFLRYESKLVGLRISTETRIASAIIGLEHGANCGYEAYDNNKPFQDFTFDMQIHDCSAILLSKASKVAGDGFGVYDLELDDKGENLVTREEKNGLIDYDIREIENKELRKALLKCVIKQGVNEH